MNEVNKTPGVQAARQVASQIRERLNAMATMLMCGTDPRRVVLRLDDLAIEVTRAVGALAGVPPDQSLLWVAEEMLTAIEARAKMLRIHAPEPGEASDTAEPQGGS